MLNSDIHNHCNQHEHPHQVFFNELMRHYDPKDPANKNRTFEKMVQSANRKHLNPGEQSFHYYIDSTDNKVHGFLAIGNINDRLPHIIITDNTNGKESALEQANRILKIVYENQTALINVQNKLEQLLDGIEFPEELFNKINEFNERLTELEGKLDNIPDSVILQQMNSFIENNQEFFNENNESASITDKIDEKLNEFCGDDADNLTDAVTNIINVNHDIVKPEWEPLDD